MCEFYQIKKHHVTCTAYKAADTFCVRVMGHAEARSLKCTDDIVVCGLPCRTRVSYVVPERCAFDSERPRGSQAPPFDFCEEEKKEPEKTKKQVGEECVHGGECVTSYCIGIGTPKIYRCSCSPSKYDLSCKNKN